MRSSIEIAEIIKTSVVDGPGVRTVLFLQGCKQNCEGCHNKHLHKKGEGRVIWIDSLVELVSKISINKKITISGGEPLEQKEELVILLKKLKKEGLEICLYTSFQLEEISQDILKYLSYIKVGRYIQEVKQEIKPFYGSSNQIFYKVNTEKGEILCQTM